MIAKVVKSIVVTRTTTWDCGYDDTIDEVIEEKRYHSPEAKLRRFARRRVKSPASLPNLSSAVPFGGIKRQRTQRSRSSHLLEPVIYFCLFSAQLSPSRIPPSGYASERTNRPLLFFSFVSGRVSVETREGKGTNGLFCFVNHVKVSSISSGPQENNRQQFPFPVKQINEGNVHLIQTGRKEVRATEQRSQAKRIALVLFRCPLHHPPR